MSNSKQNVMGIKSNFKKQLFVVLDTIDRGIDADDS